MRVEELRIGDMVLFNGLIPVKVSIDEINILLEQENHSISSIPLTPEILECCGFQAIEFKYKYFTDIAYYLKNMLIYLNTNIEVEYAPDWANFEDRNHIVGKGILKYLHHLQNLYFALTGEELEIDEKKLAEVLQMSK